MPLTGAEPNLPEVVASVAFEVNGRAVTVPDDGASLLEVVRDRLGLRAVKDGCSPQGQCGCCTVWVDGAPRVACVTPVSRVAGRRVTTPEGLPDASRWADAFCGAGASQCGFCTPGIVMRLAALAPGGDAGRALLAHLCRCTGWQTIFEVANGNVAIDPSRDLEAAGRRATIEGGVAQRVGPTVTLGEGGFADDTAPLDALVAVRAVDGRWVVGETLVEARAAAGNVPGRRTTLGLTWPLTVPEGDWARSLRTTWVEPGYLEPDASWCVPGGEPVSALANGGAFGGKAAQEVRDVARRLAGEHGRAVRVLYSREDVVRLGPKRPPVAAGVSRDGEGVIRAVRTPGIAAAVAAVAPRLRVEEVDIVGLRLQRAGAGSLRRAARSGGAAFVLHRCGAHGPRLGAE
jgi:xanthine dehydrogenase small subunit